MLCKVLITVVCLGSLAGCGSSQLVESLAKDPATISVHQVITAPGWTIQTDYVRNNATGASASAGTSGTNANIPAGATTYSPPAAK